MYLDPETKKVRSEKYYLVGYNSKIGKLMLADVISWIAWYERYFEISKEEYEMFGSDGLDALAERLHKEGTASERFLFSEKNVENTSAQLQLRDEAKVKESGE